ncbi:hypothetical protein ASF28_18695 [Methylobacterium sp. Leaf99]|uniref:hypothetical protein n=1 Tax=Methylobacterium sp. Leaf99 TaxID=1736251 RepID=UPI0006F3ED54|nr:hypothetical protein [Methylobacterium sp. Leaf99]KQP04861.1 hypothetical protein ASF28_18695 [Methylobacterium sp. Leaf99]
MQTFSRSARPIVVGVTLLLGSAVPAGAGDVWVGQIAAVPSARRALPTGNASMVPAPALQSGAAEASVTGLAVPLNPLQGVDPHRLDVRQTGSLNRLTLLQEGSGHSATVLQDGDNNSIAVTMQGVQNSLALQQVGSGQSIVALQAGFGNQMSAVQVGQGNVLRAVQR